MQPLSSNWFKAEVCESGSGEVGERQIDEDVEITPTMRQSLILCIDIFVTLCEPAEAAWGGLQRSQEGPRLSGGE